MLITHKEIIGWMAHWAVRQHPFGRPDGLFDIIHMIQRAAQDWDFGPPSLKMREFETFWDLEAWLKDALKECGDILRRWNTPRSGHTHAYLFTSRYGTPKPEHDFIDIDALLRNVAHDTFRAAEAEQRACAADRNTPVSLTDTPKPPVSPTGTPRT